MFDIGLQAKAAQFHALAAELAGAVTTDTSGRLAVELLPDVLAGVRAGELASCRLIERADRTGEFAVDGAASAAAFVRQVSGEHGGWAARRVGLGRALADQLQATSKAWEAGDLGIDHATVIHQATKDLLDAELASQLEAFLAAQAPGLTPTGLKVLAADLRAQAAPEESAAETAKKRAAQKLCLSQTLDGMWRLDGWLDPEAGLTFSQALAAFTRKPDPEGDLLTESIGHRRAEALIQLCRHASAHADTCNGEGGGRSTIIVGLRHQQLLDGLGAAGVEGGASMPASTARRMACDAGVIPVVYGALSEVLDVGRQSRTIPAGIRRQLTARDGSCVFPDCDRPASWCEGHHRREWVRHRGPTSEENLDLVCVHHHHLVHEGGWTMTIDGDRDRTPLFHPPDGRPPLRGQRHRLIQMRT